LVITCTLQCKVTAYCKWWNLTAVHTGGALTQGNSGDSLPLASPPRNFFMTIRDIAFWIRSARTDSRLNRLRLERGAASAFDQLYAGLSDPFGAELPQYRYQQRKYDSLLSMLPRRRYHNVLDVGCGLGTFTRKLAPFAEHVLGTDISAEAVGQARKLSIKHPNITYSQQDVLDNSQQEASFDLIVLADMLYYVGPLTDVGLKSIASNLSRRLAPGGLLLLVNHYFFGVDLSSRGTREIHDAFRWASRLERVAEYRRAFFLATLLRQANH
jgi:2-polyprenyl-3-methyl-5-hydroxy-6-metoxy-1,4-benzoquinol methylase